MGALCNNRLPRPCLHHICPFLVAIAAIFVGSANACEFAEREGLARCDSFTQLASFVLSSSSVALLDRVLHVEVVCGGRESDDDDHDLVLNTSSLSVSERESPLRLLPYLSTVAVHSCDGPALLTAARFPFSHLRLATLNFTGNGIAFAEWQRFRSAVNGIVDLRANPLTCGDCRNRWILDYQKRAIVARHWDAHLFLGLPQHVLTDANFALCNFSHCPSESVAVRNVTTPLAVGAPLTVQCDVAGLSVQEEEAETRDSHARHFFWPLNNEANYDDGGGASGNLNGTEPTKPLETWDRLRQRMQLRLDALTSNHLGYLSCVCQHCLLPVFDVTELRFDTDLSVRLQEDGHDAHLIVHGYPLENLTLTVVRLNDNETESKGISSATTRLDLFNGSLAVKFQSEHSHFFVLYFVIFIPECILCPPNRPTHIDGEYAWTVCRSDGHCTVASGNLSNPAHEVIQADGAGSGSSDTHLLVVIFVLAALVLLLVLLVSQTHLRHKLVEKGWEIKRRRASRNTDRTEETSIRLDDYSASSSLSYVVQHVPLIDKTNLKVNGRLGKGAFGEVHQAEWTDKDRTILVAIKMLFDVQLDSQLDKEAAMLSQLDHPNIVKMFGICRWDTQVAIVMEIMNLGDLKSYLRDRTPRCDNYSQFPPALTGSECLNIGAQVAAGLSYLHSKSIVHRDLAARNCLVQGDSDLKVCNAAFRKPISVKISDFGMSRRLYSDEYYKMHNGKTILPVRWLPPECLSSGRFTPQSDMWSFGMVLFEIFSFGAVPFGDLSNSEVLTAVVSGMKPQLPSSFPEPINNLISQCWRTSPEERISAPEALNRLQIIQ